jgi:hypothetical protein
MACSRCGREVPVHTVLGICLPPSRCWEAEMNSLNLLPSAAPPKEAPKPVAREDPKPKAKVAKLNDPIFPEAEGEELMPRYLLENKRRGERLVGKLPQPLTDYQKKVCLEWIEQAAAKEPAAEPEPAPVEPTVKKSEKAERVPTPAKPAAKPKPALERKPAPRGYHHCKTTLDLGRKIAHWLADNGGTTKPIAPYRIYRALSLARHRNWKDAIHEMEQRGIIRTVKKRLKVDASKLLNFEMEISRKEARKKNRPRRPPTQWFLDHLSEFNRRDGLPVDSDAGEEDADESTQEAQESGDDEWGS